MGQERRLRVKNTPGSIRGKKERGRVGCMGDPSYERKGKEPHWLNNVNVEARKRSRKRGGKKSLRHDFMAVGGKGERKKKKKKTGKKPAW